MSTRYKIILQNNDYSVGSGYKQFTYVVCTCLDERKAVVMAACAYLQEHSQERIYKVVSVEKLEGTEAEKADIVDRMEY